MSEARPQLACIVPAFQAGTTIETVLRGVASAVPGSMRIVIDDGSTDDTQKLAQRNAEHVIHCETNRGKGAALRTGFATALANGATIVVTLDADGQHDPAFIPALVRALDGADIAIGARSREGAMPMRRRVTNALASASIGAIMRAAIPDAQSGFRAMHRRVVEQVSAVGDGYEYETDFLIRAGRAGFRVVPVQVPTIYGAPSHFHPWHDSLAVVRTIWRHRAGAFR